MKPLEQRPRWQSYLFLHIALLLYAAATVFAKYAGLAGSLTHMLPFVVLEFACLGLYALLWQVVLKRISLTAAYANKAICVVWAYLFGWLLFAERLTLGKGIGAALVIAGILVVVSEHD